ncbi:MAG: NADP-dependent phosphogluconate dehydrogenase [Smithella sp.]|jgi:6-phosphogluconate dehydrogenase|nr:NADP-dependent phosphogluconate dehydrogenase [Smithella sp.]
MKIAIAGLGKMGAQIAKKLHEDEHAVIVYNRSKGPIDEMKNLGMIPAYERADVVNSFNGEQVIIWMMVPADVVDQELDEWLKIMPKKSILIDGGNSDFRLTKKHAEKVSKEGSVLMDVGTSGGIWGYKNGFSMMVGGNTEAFKIIEPIFKTLEKPSGAYHYFRESGAGHYVKMVHNAIEYGMMESLAEGYWLLKEGPYKNLDLVSVGEVWQHRSVITSWLNELTMNALKENPELKEVDGVVAESGEARFALEVAKSFNIEMPSILSAFEVRIASQKGKINFATKLLALMRNAFGGHKINPHT